MKMHAKIHTYKIISAFTLAEVLITLGIIGIVAALTIPTLLYNQQKQAAASQVKEAYSILSQTTAHISNDCGGNITGCLTNPNAADQDATTRSEIANLYKSKLSLAKDCTDGTTTGCFANTTYVSFNNTGWVSNFDTATNFANARFILANGISVAFQYRGPAHVGSYFDVYIDLNSAKTPNQFGRDFFGFHYILNERRIIPDTSNDCAAGSNGYGCASKIIQEGAINYY